MKIAYVSDIHLESNDKCVVNKIDADVLVLAGDIVPYIKIERLNGFFKDCAAKYPKVIYIAGNHEYYGGKIDKADGVITNALNQCKNVHYLNNKCLFIDDVMFFGGTLWSDLSKSPLHTAIAEQYMNDYKYIRVASKDYMKLRAYETNYFHNVTVNAIKGVVQLYSEYKKVIVTHHAPSFASIPERFINHPANIAYASDLSDLILDNPAIKLWIHGHIHDQTDYMLGDTRIVSNPKGYFGELSYSDEVIPKLVEV